jgi:iron complex transport system permease protein
MTTQTTSLVRSENTPNRFVLRLLGVLVCVGVLGLTLLWSITLGAADITPQTVYEALWQFDDQNFDHLIIQTVRLPRVLAGVLVGASLAIAGGIMQGLTRNPLADPAILGISGGATFAVVLAITALGAIPLSLYAVVAFIGGAIAALLVYTLGSIGRGGATPLKLTLAGVIFTSFMGSVTTVLLLLNPDTLDQVRFWTAGSLAGRDMSLVTQTAPYMLVGIVLAVLLARQITTISLGEDVATGLGQNTLWVKACAAFVVVLLAGGAVALAGPIGFVGLIVPHVVRWGVGADYRWILPYSAVGGGILVTICDVGARLLIRPQEFPTGVMLALVGAPFFIALARWKVKR